MAKPAKKATKKAVKKAVKKLVKTGKKAQPKKAPVKQKAAAKKVSNNPTLKQTKPAPKKNENPSKNTYSKSTQDLTLKILEDMPVSSFFRGYCILKYSGKEYSRGRILLTDAMNYDAIVRDINSDEILVTYDNFEEMVADGWVVD